MRLDSEKLMNSLNSLYLWDHTNFSIIMTRDSENYYVRSTVSVTSFKSNRRHEYWKNGEHKWGVRIKYSRIGCLWAMGIRSRADGFFCSIRFHWVVQSRAKKIESCFLYHIHDFRLWVCVSLIFRFTSESDEVVRVVWLKFNGFSKTHSRIFRYYPHVVDSVHTEVEKTIPAYAKQ